MIYLVVFILLLLCSLAYFRLAARFNIIDKPNERSSHSSPIIRGGGIIFIAAALITMVLYAKEFWLLGLGIFIIGTISFLDDIYTLSNKIRLVFHMIAVSLMFTYLSVYTSMPVYWVIALYILVIGIINAYNFMDGINGITGVYSLVALLTLQVVNLQQLSFVQPDIIWFPVLACLVFLYFNFRKKAACFAGDVGSVTIAFYIIALLFKLIFATGNWTYILFLAVYGVDAVLTILHRLLLKQNIFAAHRLHFYQILANDRKISHLTVASIYGMLQAVINAFILTSHLDGVLLTIIVCVPLVIAYIILKPRWMAKPVTVSL